MRCRSSWIGPVRLPASGLHASGHAARAVLAGGLLWSALAAPTKAASFELRLVADDAAATISAPLLTAGDVLHAQALTRRSWSVIWGPRSGSEVVLTLAPAAAQRLEAETAGAVGRRYVVVIDGESVQQAVLMGPLSGTQLSIASSFTPAQARALARQLQPAERQ